MNFFLPNRKTIEKHVRVIQLRQETFQIKSNFCKWRKQQVKNQTNKILLNKYSKFFTGYIETPDFSLNPLITSPGQIVWLL